MDCSETYDCEECCGNGFILESLVDIYIRVKCEKCDGTGKLEFITWSSGGQND